MLWCFIPVSWQTLQQGSKLESRSLCCQEIKAQYWCYLIQNSCCILVFKRKRNNTQTTNGTLNPKELLKRRLSQKVTVIVSEGQQCYWLTWCALLHLVLLSWCSFQQLEIIAGVIPPEPGIWNLFCRLVGLGLVLHRVSASHSNSYLCFALVDDAAITNVRRWVDLNSLSLWKSGITLAFTAITISSQH